MKKDYYIMMKEKGEPTYSELVKRNGSRNVFSSKKKANEFISKLKTDKIYGDGFHNAIYMVKKK